MKFYEFNLNNFGYYALLMADSKEAAIKFYEKHICDIEGKNQPQEVSFEYTMNKVNKTLEYDLDKESYKNIFEEMFSKFNPCMLLNASILLLDKCLL